MISLNNISLGFGAQTILKEASFLINVKDRIGLVGNNGAGKTTLLKIIYGLLNPDSGSVERPGEITMGYLPQQMSHLDSKTLLNEVKGAFTEILELDLKLSKLNRELETREDYHSEEYMDLLSRISEVSSRIESLGASKISERIEKTLTGLGFSPLDFSRQTSQFSGGWRMRIELAKILLRRPDLILLDEPTNHLDIESIQWLEEFLSDYPGAVIIISHDRAFLDNVTKRTIEISLGKIFDYKASYSKYVDLRNERRTQQLAAFKNQQKEISDTERFIERFRYKATKAVQVQSRIKQLDKIDRIEVDDLDTSTINIRFPAAPRSGNMVIEAEGLSKNYGNKIVLENIDISILRSERVAFVGKNGEGKTTLARILVGDLDYSGNLKTGHNVKTGYFAQNQDELLEADSTVFETVDRIAEGESKNKLRSLLGAFLFKNDDIEKKVKVLSGGERSRLALIKLLLEPYNLLVLDEPTNHLDMHSKDILKKALSNYSGTLILVSHDREFLDGLVNKVYEFKDKKITPYTGTIFEFLQKKKLDSLKMLEEKNAKIPGRKNSDSAGKDSYIEKKELHKNLRKISKQISSCEKDIEFLEKEISVLSLKIENKNYEYSQNDKEDIFVKYGNYKKELDEKLLVWEKLHKQLEEYDRVSQEDTASSNK